MTEEQRVKLEQLISEFEQVVLLAHDGFSLPTKYSQEYGLSQRDKAYDRITDHLKYIQWSAALYNFQRFGVKNLEDLDLTEATGVTRREED